MGQRILHQDREWCLILEVLSLRIHHDVVHRCRARIMFIAQLYLLGMDTIFCFSFINIQHSFCAPVHI